MTALYLRARMVGVAQLVELRLVMPAVVGSNPIVHPIPFSPASPSARLAIHPHVSVFRDLTLHHILGDSLSRLNIGVSQ